ncbi:aspartate carbamoyltransferase regulatory subunit [Alloscardovia macacae]|uniref:Aspartate carbamoyltransferase regulatory subunit n=1 Tax=Alloscardovia macacae TaxID=1160091 RepID=A0A1Y2T055_9BIFI|nr:aspartate carbamoyltransferase regulatory subunit [Alloscardovia macacae]OTA25481.1 aspartate carbamoyltransferase regulatory subunit [Alloscardovia macacae]OTA30140.1 aspartate carbamoyltransferase regulatory subunit [Alloscardovia macacae]
MQVTSITDGIIIDHVPAGHALKVLDFLGIDPRKTRLALIMNAQSPTFGTKDIIKIESDVVVDLNILALVAPSATVNVVRAGEIISKEKPALPLHVTNVITCVNPRCVTSTERGIKQQFHLVRGHEDARGMQYRCDYCDEEAKL